MHMPHDFNYIRTPVGTRRKDKGQKESYLNDLRVHTQAHTHSQKIQIKIIAALPHSFSLLLVLGEHLYFSSQGLLCGKWVGRGVDRKWGGTPMWKETQKKLKGA